MEQLTKPPLQNSPIEIHPVANGFMVSEPYDLRRQGMGVNLLDTFVFESFEGLMQFLAVRFPKRVKKVLHD